ncbi:MAG: glucosaminidase domain-containing protein [Alphaproteobacteria bacterium]|nr:glucosaminidase domain-containing protein [Alphaproteobacteria bacterium]
MIAALVLIAVQLGVAGLFGFKPPAFETGYYEPEVKTVSAPSTSVLSEARRQELEALLSPPPVLAFADLSSSTLLPDDLTDSAVLLSFADKPAGEASPETDTSNRTTLAANIPQEDSIVPPTALPELPDLPEASGAVLEIEPVYLASLPELERLSVTQRKKRFVAIILPLILRANAELEERRRLVEQAADKGDLKRLRKWAELYRYTTGSDDIEEIRAALLERVDTVPVSLALAQAAIESGWGTSRFSVQGNALFGQWAWSRDQGIRPSQSKYENAVVRSFVTLFDSVRAYMHNLNTHRSYDDFRKARGNPDADIADMIKTLTSYSEEGEVYVSKLFSLITKNNFRNYENAVLSTK